MGLKLKKVLKSFTEPAVNLGKSIATGDLKGIAKNTLKSAMMYNPMTGLPYATLDALKDQAAELTDVEKAAAATLAPVDPNVEMQRLMAEERKRRIRTPGRAQYMLGSASNLPSLIGDNSALGKNGLF